MRASSFSIPLTAAVMACALLVGSTDLRAQEGASETMAPMPETEWQDAITGQIQAFRDGDAPAAFSFAASSFQEGFSNPMLFYRAILGSGYTPIRESRSHSFGAFEEVGEDIVLQTVRLVGTNQQLYEAIYQLAREEGGWKVMGVRLTQQQGIGI